MKRDTNEMKEWLYDLTNRRITDDAIVKGFLKHYALHGLTIAHVQQDIHFRTCYNDEDCRRAMETLKEALTAHANAPEPPESRGAADCSSCQSRDPDTGCLRGSGRGRKSICCETVLVR